MENIWNLTYWLPSITSTTALAAVLWLSRQLITTRLTKSVEHSFNSKLEVLRAELRKSEESYKADLKTKETEIAALRSGAMSALASRQAAVDKRRLEAIDELWKAVTDLGFAKYAATFMQSIKFESALSECSKNEAARAVFKAAFPNELRHDQFKQAGTVRPFISEMSWALFSAYQSIAGIAVLQIHMLKNGINLPNILDKDGIVKMAVTALPHRAEFIETHGFTACHYLLDELETRLLEELRRMLAGQDGDKASIEQAAMILQVTNQVQKSLLRETANLA